MSADNNSCAKMSTAKCLHVEQSLERLGNCIARDGFAGLALVALRDLTVTHPLLFPCLPFEVLFLRPMPTTSRGCGPCFHAATLLGWHRPRHDRGSRTFCRRFEVGYSVGPLGKSLTQRLACQEQVKLEWIINPNPAPLPFPHSHYALRF